MNTSNPPVLGMILKGYPRISETFISNEILLLEQLGFRIHLFSMRRPRENFSHESVKQIRAPVDYLPDSLFLPLPKLLYHNLLLAIKRPDNYVLALKTALKWFFRSLRITTIKHLLQAGYLVRHLLPGSNVVHLHAHFAHSPAAVALFVSQLSGLSFSFSAHAKDIYISDPHLLQEKIALARFTVTCTEYNRQYLQGLFPVLGNRIHRSYHGINLDLFSQDKRGGTPAAPFRILTVARLTAKKGLPTVFRALKALCDQGLAIQHTLIGDGEDRDKILRFINDQGLNQVTKWLGTQPHGVVLSHYRQADLFVLGCEVATNGDRDGIPNVFLECMAMGIPVVATHVSAIPELIEDGKTGLLVPPGRPQEMAQAMIRLLTDHDLRYNIVTAARSRVVQKFDNKILINDLAGRFRAVGL